MPIIHRRIRSLSLGLKDDLLHKALGVGTQGLYKSWAQKCMLVSQHQGSQGDPSLVKVMSSSSYTTLHRHPHVHCTYRNTQVGETQGFQGGLNYFAGLRPELHEKLPSYPAPLPAPKKKLRQICLLQMSLRAVCSKGGCRGCPHSQFSAALHIAQSMQSERFYLVSA